MKLIRILPISLLVLPVLATAFTLFSIDSKPTSTSAGEWVSRASVRSRGMGGAGLSLCDTLNSTPASPASYGFLDYTLLSVSFSPEFTKLTDNGAGITHTDYGQDFPVAEIIVPMGRYGTLFGGYVRDRILDYDISFKDDLGYSIRRTGSGGTYIAHAGYSFSRNRIWSVGFAVGQLYGSTLIQNAVDVSNLPAGGSSAMQSTLQKTYFSNSTLELGAMGKFQKFGLGLSATLPIGKTTIEKKIQDIQHGKGDSLVIPRLLSLSEDNMPANFSVGLSYFPSKHLDCALDLNTIYWKSEGRSLEYRIGTGMEWRFSNDRNDHYYLNIPLRTGYFFRNYGYADPILEQGITFGLTLPTVNHFGYITTSLELGRRYQDSFSSSNLTEEFSKISVQYIHKGRWGRLRKASVGDF